MDVEAIIKRLVSDEDIKSKEGGKIYMKRIFTVEVGDKYKDEFAVEIFGKANQRMPEIRVGDTIKLTFTISSREWKGKFFTSVRAIYIEILKMNLGAEEWPSGGRRTEMFNEHGDANEHAKPVETQVQYLERLAKEQGYNSVKEHDEVTGKSKGNDLPFIVTLFLTTELIASMLI